MTVIAKRNAEAVRAIPDGIDMSSTITSVEVIELKPVKRFRAWMAHNDFWAVLFVLPFTGLFIADISFVPWWAAIPGCAVIAVCMIITACVLAHQDKGGNRG